ncbi:hypothetical protein ACC778_33215, partial [Rhizobium ruizarguesonis]
RYRTNNSNQKPLERTQNWIELGGKVTPDRKNGRGFAAFGQMAWPTREMREGHTSRPSDDELVDLPTCPYECLNHVLAATDEACIILRSTHLSVLKQRMTVWLRSVVGVHSW